MAYYNTRAVADGRLTERHLAELICHWQRSNGLAVDGKAGPDTRASLLTAQDPDAVIVLDESDLITLVRSAPEPHDQIDPSGTVWAPWSDGRLPFIPKDREELEGLLGHPGPVARPNKRWRKGHIVSVKDLPGVDRWVSLHELVEPMAREGLRRALWASRYEIRRCGGFVHRHIRRDPHRELSLHSWGAALDINPDDNGPRKFPKGSAPVPWSEQWNRLWPRGVPREFVEAMESVGWTWGGAWGTRGEDLTERVERVRFCDPMHFEARDR